VKGWVLRQENPASRREQIILVTAQGIAMQKRLMPLAKQVTARAVEGLSFEKLKETELVLKQITDNLS